MNPLTDAQDREAQEHRGFTERVVTVLARRVAARRWASAAASPRRVLVVDLDNLGDLLLATPAIRALRRRFPDATLDALVTEYAAPALRGNPHIDEILTCDKAVAVGPVRSRIHLAWRLRRRRYDLGVILEAHWGFAGFAEILLAAAGVPRRIGRDLGKYHDLLTDRVPVRQQHWVDTYLDVVGLVDAAADGRGMDAVIRAEDVEAVDTWARAHNLTRAAPLVLFPGGNQHLISRRWGVRGFAAVGDALAGRLAAPVILIGGPQDAGLINDLRGLMRAPSVPATGALSWGATGALLRGCRLFITNDSGPLHLAAAVGAPTVAVFGPTDPTVFGPRDAPHAVVRAALPCSPCIRVGDFPPCAIVPREHCLLSVTPDMVLTAAECVLARVAGASRGVR
jgi:heptosyltransferase-2/heptosyltransferase-3